MLKKDVLLHRLVVVVVVVGGQDDGEFGHKPIGELQEPSFGRRGPCGLRWGRWRVGSVDQKRGGKKGKKTLALPHFLAEIVKNPIEGGEERGGHRLRSLWEGKDERRAVGVEEKTRERRDSHHPTSFFFLLSAMAQPMVRSAFSR